MSIQYSSKSDVNNTMNDRNYIGGTAPPIEYVLLNI